MALLVQGSAAYRFSLWKPFGMESSGLIFEARGVLVSTFSVFSFWMSLFGLVGVLLFHGFRAYPEP